MLTHPTLEKLGTLRLSGMAKAYAEQLQMPDVHSMSFDDRLGLLIEREETERASRRLKNRLRLAKLRQAACVENIDFRHPRGLDKAMLLELASCRWIVNHHNLLITGPTGVGKTFIACALAHKACLQGYTVRYLHLPKLLRELTIAKADGRYPKLLTSLARTDLIVLDDWGLTTLTDADRRDLYEILEDRNGLRSTAVTSQLPVDKWHRAIGDPTIADAILDRLVCDAYRIALTGDSMRRHRLHLAGQQDRDDTT
jgi:DNA replication protein DnaC